MVDPLHKKSWLLVIGLLFMVILSSSVIYAQAGDGTITVNACTDQNADGDCTDDFDSAAPPGVEACLDDDTNCQSIPATFTNLAAGSYTPFLRFPGASQGYYPTTALTPVDLADGEALDVTLGAVYPIHPKGVAVHEQLNKVYVAFQGPTVISGTEKSSPYPFVAVIDGDTDEVLRTIPGGEDGLVDPSPNSGFSGIGREPWGVAVSGDSQLVFVGSFGDGLVSFINPTTDMVTTNYFFGTEFKPTAPSLNPITGNVNFPDYEQGHLVILGTNPGNEQVAAPFIELPPTAFSPFEVVTANALDGYNFVTLRDAILPGPYRIAALNSNDPFGTEFLPIQLPDASSGPPFAIGLWQEEGMSEPRIFITHADDPRLNPPDFINPNKLLVYSFPVVDPKNILLRNSGIQLGDFAEAGLVHDPVVNLMRGTFGGFAYTNDNGDIAACDNSARGGTYTVNFDGGISSGPEPSIVVGNPPLVDSGLQWKNPFEIAVNPNTGKVYVTDRCWNEFPEGGQPGGGAVLIFETSANGEATSTPTVTPTTTTTSTVTATPTATQTTTPGQITLVMNGPSSVALNETFSVGVVAQNVPTPGLYGAQFEINFDPALVSAGNLQINPDLSLVIIQNVDNVTGTITLAAAREGNVPGLTGDVTLLTFEVTAGDTPSTANFIFENVKIGDPQAQAFDVTSQNYSVLIGDVATATPTPTGTPPTATPTATGTPPTATPTATGTPPTSTPTSTGTPPTSTPTATGTPPTSTPTSTGTPPTSTPTSTGTPPTSTPTSTGTPPTSTPTSTGTPPTATPTATGTPPTSTPTSTGTPSTATPNVTVIVTSTGTPSTATPTATGTPPTSTPTSTGTPPTATPTVTGTPPTATPTVTGTPPTSTPTSTGTPPTATPTVTGTPPTSTPTSTGTPPTATPTVTGTPPTSTPTSTGTPPTATPTVTGTPPTSTPTPTPQVTVVVTVVGQVILPGRAGNDWSDTTVTIDDTAQSSTTDAEGNFSIADVTVGVHSSITARTTGFLSAACNSFTVTSSETDLLAVSLLSGDVSDDDTVDITDATAIGVSFGNTGSGLAADINRDDIVDILDIILVGINFGTAGPQVWTCQ